MDQENRVLCRNGARELTEQETGLIHGGLRTLTPCTIGPGPHQRVLAIKQSPSPKAACKLLF